MPSMRKPSDPTVRPRCNSTVDRRIVIDTEAIAVGRFSHAIDVIAHAVVVELVVGDGGAAEVAVIGDADAVVEVLAEVVAVEGEVLHAPAGLDAQAVPVAADIEHTIAIKVGGRTAGGKVPSQPRLLLIALLTIFSSRTSLIKPVM
jgi:hypothetical protein